MGDYLRARVPLAVTACFVAENGAFASELTETPLFLLDFTDRANEEMLFIAMLEVEPPGAIGLDASLWVRTELDPGGEYGEAHSGHPILEMRLEPPEAPSGLPKLLTFLLCVQCESVLMADLTAGPGYAGIMAAPPENDSDHDESIPPILLCTCSFDQIATSELWAWRHAYG